MTLQFNFKRVYGRAKFYPYDRVSKIMLGETKVCFNVDEFIQLFRFAKALEIEVLVYNGESPMTAKELITILKPDSKIK